LGQLAFEFDTKMATTTKDANRDENERYEKICELIWNLKESVRESLPDGSVRKAVFPPVRRRKVDLLIIGQSPNHNGVPYDGNVKQETIEHASRYEFIRRNSCDRPDPRYNHAYYEKLIAFVRQVDERLGVWWEMEESIRKLCVEFADALPLATIPRPTRDFDSVIEQPTVRNSCKNVLSAILDYYEPRVILANGSFPSILLRELHTQNRDTLPSTGTFVVRQDNKRQVHLSRFIDERLDEFCRDRLVTEMKTHWPFPRT
jgi:hypothetical protein